MEQNVKTQELTYDSRDGVSKIYAKKWIPSVEPKCILQIIHGMCEHIGRYDEFARFLAEQGILVVAADRLGHGQTARINHAKQGYFCKQDPATVLVRDEHRLKKTIEKEYPLVPYIIYGHSMGSFILRNYLLKYGTGIKGAIICGSGDPKKVSINTSLAACKVLGLFCGQKHTSPMLDRIAFSSYNKRIQSKKTDYDWFSKNEENVQQFLADPDCGFIFTVNGFETIAILLKRLKNPESLKAMPKELPILLLAGTDDPVGDYGEGVKRIARSYLDCGMKNVSLKLYEGDRHEILNELDREEVYQDIFAWLKVYGYGEKAE